MVPYYKTLLYDIFNKNKTNLYTVILDKCNISIMSYWTAYLIEYIPTL